MKGFDELVGKTIVSANVRQHSKFDDTGYLDLTFADGTSCCIVGDYSGYTGNSFDEYSTQIHIMPVGYEHASGNYPPNN